MKLKEKIQKLAGEVAENTYSDSRTVIVFTDFTFTVVTGSWEAQKPVWVAFTGQCTESEVFEALVNGYESKEGIPGSMLGINLIYGLSLLDITLVGICEELNIIITGGL